ncbi:hypothetical protein SNEBB_008472 [Seison nebaliae]|nr:hypothetical protein SNEBB_008472 [Seison nebaliae]
MTSNDSSISKRDTRNLTSKSEATQSDNGSRIKSILKQMTDNKANKSHLQPSTDSGELDSNIFGNRSVYAVENLNKDKIILQMTNTRNPVAVRKKKKRTVDIAFGRSNSGTLITLNSNDNHESQTESQKTLKLNDIILNLSNTESLSRTVETYGSVEIKKIRRTDDVILIDGDAPICPIDKPAVKVAKFGQKVQFVNKPDIVDITNNISSLSSSDTGAIMSSVSMRSTSERDGSPISQPREIRCKCCGHIAGVIHAGKAIFRSSCNDSKQLDSYVR